MRKGDFYSTFSQVSCEVNLHITNSFLLCANSNLKKDVFRLITSVGPEKNSESNEESNLKPSDSALRCSTTEPQRLHGERGLRSS